MLKIRYSLKTKEVNAWRSGDRPIGRGRADEAIAELDIPLPDKPLGAWLFDGTTLIPNPSYIELTPQV